VGKYLPKHCSRAYSSCDDNFENAPDEVYMKVVPTRIKCLRTVGMKLLFIDYELKMYFPYNGGYGNAINSN